MTDYSREAARDQLAENLPRQGWAFGTATTTGIGRKFFSKPINFGLTFYQKPIFGYGYEIEDVDPDAEAHPMSVGFVYEWVQDERGFYVGAHVAVSVSWVPEPTELLDDPVLEHHFTFSAKALKDVMSTGGEDIAEDTSGA